MRKKELVVDEESVRIIAHGGAIMHFIVAWDIKESGDSWHIVNDALEECLEGVSVVKPLRTLFIVKVGDDEARQEIISDLCDVCEAFQKKKVKVLLLVGPLCEKSNYQGRLTPAMWKKIERRTG